MRAGQKPRCMMSRTDVHRPFWVKVYDSPSNYKEVHNHARRPLRDGKGNYVRVDVPGEAWPNGRQKTRIVTVPFTECDLPADPSHDEGGYWDGCHWTYTKEFINSGMARHSCATCSESDYVKQENRKQCRARTREARNTNA